MGASLRPSHTGAGAWHMAQRVVTTSTASAGALGALAASRITGGARPSVGCTPGEPEVATQNAPQSAAAAAAHAHHGAREWSACQEL